MEKNKDTIIIRFAALIIAILALLVEVYICIQVMNDNIKFTWVTHWLLAVDAVCVAAVYYCDWLDNKREERSRMVE